VTVIVEIEPTNDFSPVFKAAHYSFLVPETSRGKSSLTSIMLKHPQRNIYPISYEHDGENTASSTNVAGKTVYLPAEN
jgi:hypothetical protein